MIGNNIIIKIHNYNYYVNFVIKQNLLNHNNKKILLIELII